MYSLKLIIKTFLLIIAINLNLVLTVDNWNNIITLNQSTFGDSLIQLRRGSASGHLSGIKIWDTDTGTLIKHITNVVSHIFLCLSDGSLAIDDYRMITILDIETGEIKNKFSGYNNLLTSLVQLPGYSLASSHFSEGIRIWDTHTGILIKHITNVESDVLLCLSDGSLASAYKTITILDIETGEIKKKFSGHTDFITSLVQLPDDSLISGSEDKTIRRWDINDKGIKIKEFNKLNGHSSGISSLVRLLDGSLASGSLDNSIKIWDIERGEIIKTLTGHKSPVLSLVVLNDGSLASGSDDKTIRIWNIKQETTIKILGHTSSVRSLVVLKDGSLASGSYDDYDETIRIRGRGKDFVEDYSNLKFLFKIFIFCIVIGIVSITIFLISIFIYTYYKFLLLNQSLIIYLKLKFGAKEKSQNLSQQHFQNIENHYYFHLFHLH